MPPPDSPSRVNMRDIALKLGINMSTVSRALRNDPRISTAMQNRVQAAAKELGYRPDPMLSALAAYRQSRTPASITSELAWLNTWQDPKKLHALGEFRLYWEGASQEAALAGYRLEEFVINARLPPARLENILRARNIRGILMPPAGRDAFSGWGDFHWEDFSVVRFGYSIENPRVHRVTSDQLTDGLIATRSMWESGYRRIGLVTSRQSFTRFSAGYVYAQLSRNYELPPVPLSIDEQLEKTAQRRLEAWLKKTKPDAILTDLPSLREKLALAGLRVPQDIGLAALSVLDGNADAGIYQNSAEIGKAAVQLLISLIHHNERGIPAICREVLVEGRWVDGKSLPLRHGRATPS